MVREMHPDLRIQTVVTEETPPKVLIRESESAHIVAIGATGTHPAFGHLGSTLLAVTSHGSGAVVVVRGPEGPPPPPDVPLGPIVVGLDGSRVSEAAVGAAFVEAGERAAQLIAVHVANDIPLDLGVETASMVPDHDERLADAESALAQQLAGWQEKYPEVEVLRKTYLFDPQHQLTEWSEHAQLVVVGSRGRGGFRRLLLGSTSSALVQHAHCSVMVVHPD